MSIFHFRKRPSNKEEDRKRWEGIANRAAARANRHPQIGQNPLVKALEKDFQDIKNGKK